MARMPMMNDTPEPPGPIPGADTPALPGPGKAPAIGAKPAGKMPQSEAMYRGPEDRCEECQHFIEPSGCRKVDGVIDPDGWCKLYSASAYEQGEQGEPEEGEEEPEIPEKGPLFE